MNVFMYVCKYVRTYQYKELEGIYIWGGFG